VGCAFLNPKVTFSAHELSELSELSELNALNALPMQGLSFSSGFWVRGNIVVCDQVLGGLLFVILDF
jgi:hypothetical protein